MSTIRAYRLVKRKWRQAAFDGEGARLYGGRWNSKGKACVYLAGSASLAMLEVMVHLDDYQLLEHYTLLEVALQKSTVMSLSTESLPKDWAVEPAPASTAEIGDNWLESQSSLALAVPSTVVPRERNYLINPEHARFQALIDSAAEIAFTPDKRL